MGTVAAVGDAVRSVRVGRSRFGRRTYRRSHVPALPHRPGAYLRARQDHRRRLRRGVRRISSRFRSTTCGGSIRRFRTSFAAIFDPLGNAVHTVMAAGVSIKSVVITGVGSIGLMAIPVARAAGACVGLSPIDVNPAQLELRETPRRRRRRFFPTQAGLARRNQAVAPSGDGVDVLLEMSGSGAAIDTRSRRRYATADGRAARHSEPTTSASIWRSA